MICCNSCPFHPNSGYAEERCQRPLCLNNRLTGHKCLRFLVSRCFFDFYVIKNLYQGDSLAEQLAEISLKKAIKVRDRALLLSLLHAAKDQMRFRLWSWLENCEPRSLWLLNPIFSAAGLLPIASFGGLGSRRKIYLEALMANPYSGTNYQTICCTSFLGGAKL